MAPNRNERYQAVARATLGGLSGTAYEKGLELVKALVDDWYDGADGIDPDDLFQIGLNDLETALAAVPQAEVVRKLEYMVLERKVELVSTRAFQLAQQVVDGKRTTTDAYASAKVIAGEIDDLLKPVRQIQDEDLKQRLSSQLADGDLELRYIMEGESGVMSIRLNRYLQSR